MMHAEVWAAIWLTFKLAAITTILLLVFGLPLAHWLNTTRWRGSILLESIISLPIVLPPTVIGFYLLVLFAPQNPLGSLWVKATGSPLAFSFAGLVVGSILYSLPFAIQPFQAALKTIPPHLVESAQVSGANWMQVFWHITLPLARRGIGVGVILSFAHTVGEFGVVLMLGGAIPGVTKVASILLYDEVQKLNYGTAHQIALILLAISFCLIFLMNVLQKGSHTDSPI